MCRIASSKVAIYQISCQLYPYLQMKQQQKIRRPVICLIHLERKVETTLLYSEVNLPVLRLPDSPKPSKRVASSPRPVPAAASFNTLRGRAAMFPTRILLYVILRLPFRVVITSGDCCSIKKTHISPWICLFPAQRKGCLLLGKSNFQVCVGVMSRLK